ncbi:hypothetical protein AWC29_17955 [Mycobacterium triplex]|uniref:Uncharacterized protein n=1 Tax=Mycobacterium triplex TaxID=47839 RepID=A0ABX3W4S0_9MYCO|nr:hypothetical protein AWC29_17955 [Mycobacterium triplex]
MTGRCLSLAGNDSMYGKGRCVCSSRATPTKPTSASGIAACASSTIPSPARNTGTSSGGLVNRFPSVSASGVRILTGVVAASRVAS